MNTYFVNYNDLEGRLDPSAYHPTRLNAVKRIKSLSCDVLPLSQVATFKRDIVSEASEDTPYFGLENIEGDTGIASDVDQGKEFGSAFSFNAGNILFPKLRPYLNKVHLATTEGICSTEFHILEAHKCSNYYLFAFLSSHLVVNQTSYLMTGNTLPRLQTKDVEDLLIPILPEEKQKQITNLLKKAYETREQKLKQADELLSSIDGFVRQQLGIDYQEPEEEKIYTVNSQDLDGNRQDPYYHNPKFATTINQLKSSKYPIKELGNYITEIRYGASVKNDYMADGIPLLRILNLKPNHIDLTDVVHLPKSKEKEIGNCFVYENDLLISRSGSIGIVAVVPKKADGFAYGSFMIKFRLNEQLNNNYASVWLNSDISKLLVQRERIGAIQGNITIPTIQSFLLPLPPLEKQKDISNKVMEKYQEVEKLKTEASKLLNEAKKQVEAMILN
ncbi:restriction endonuclease subunit S [Patescibacteria group bacterium]|nr:restriction endonuclease subunit S [Patescibacteria group bacterium]MCL5010007.1 restriction endonuclease subunit S [Patescibacteria group bacterium]